MNNYRQLCRSDPGPAAPAPNMGLYGSEYWTYLLPKRVGECAARSIADECLPLIAREAVSMGIGDILMEESWSHYHNSLSAFCRELAGDGAFSKRRADKRRERSYDEGVKPLQRYQHEELTHMLKSFLDPESEYHRARRHFVYKTGGGRLPAQIASHRRADDAKPIWTGDTENRQLQKQASRKKWGCFSVPVVQPLG